MFAKFCKPAAFRGIYFKVISVFKFSSWQLFLHSTIGNYVFIKPMLYILSVKPDKKFFYEKATGKKHLQSRSCTKSIDISKRIFNLYVIFLLKHPNTTMSGDSL